MVHNGLDMYGVGVLPIEMGCGCSGYQLRMCAVLGTQQVCDPSDGISTLFGLQLQFLGVGEEEMGGVRWILASRTEERNDEKDGRFQSLWQLLSRRTQMPAYVVSP